MKKILFIMILSCIMMLNSCNSRFDFNAFLSPDGVNINQLITKKYDSNDLKLILASKGTVKDLNKKFPIECMRKKDTSYRISYLGQNIIVVVTVDNKGKILYSTEHVLNLSKSDFSTINLGDKIEKVIAVDKDGEYLFLKTGRNDMPRTSLHYTIDGYLIEVKYSDDLIVEDIIYNLL